MISEFLLPCVFAKSFQNYVAHEVAAYVRKTGVDLT
jgi:hypothetical protein